MVETAPKLRRDLCKSPSLRTSFTIRHDPGPWYLEKLSTDGRFNFNLGVSRVPSTLFVESI